MTERRDRGPSGHRTTDSDSWGVPAYPQEDVIATIDPVRKLEDSTSLCALVCPRCSQLWVTTARRGEAFRCRSCRHPFRAGEESPFEAITAGTTGASGDVSEAFSVLRVFLARCVTHRSGEPTPDGGAAVGDLEPS